MKVNNNKNKKRRKTQIERKLMFPTLQYPVQNKFLKKKKNILTLQKMVDNKFQMSVYKQKTDCSVKIILLLSYFVSFEITSVPNLFKKEKEKNSLFK